MIKCIVAMDIKIILLGSKSAFLVLIVVVVFFWNDSRMNWEISWFSFN